MRQAVMGCLMLVGSMAAEAGMDAGTSWPFNGYLEASLSSVVAVVPNMPSVKDPSKMVTQIWLQAGMRGGTSMTTATGVAVCESNSRSVSEETRCYDFK